MKNMFSDKVYYSDTDAYGVVWHGAYLRWMEKGRILFCDDLGLNLIDLKESDIAMPVANINIRYKSPAKIDEKYQVITTISKITPLSITFHQVISNPDDGQVYTDAEVIVVAVNNSGKLYRRLPEKLTKYLNERIICKD